MWLLARCPLGLQLRLGRVLGWLSYYLASRRRKVAQINLELCFPHWSTAQRQQVLKQHFYALGQGTVETAAAWWSRDTQLQGRVDYYGLEHLHAAQALQQHQGRGIILLTGHFTCLELGARFVTWQTAFHAMYRPHKNPLYEELMRRCRAQQSRRPPLARDNLRATVRALRAGEALWYAPDQNYGGVESVFAPFFGVPALTITATARLAKLGRAQILPYSVRDQGNGRYAIEFYPAWQDYPSGDDYADALRINQFLEHAIAQAPEQYLWVHRRFKTRPAGEAKFY